MFHFHPIPYLKIGVTYIPIHIVFLNIILILFFFNLYRILSKNLNMSFKTKISFIFSLLLISFLFGRLFSFFIDGKNIYSILDFFNPTIFGLHSLGLFFGGSIYFVVFLYLYINNLYLFQRKIFKISDQLVFTIPIYIILYRTACFLKGCCYGLISSVPWAVSYYPNHLGRHPTQIYYIINAIFIYSILYLFFNKPKTNKSMFGIIYPGQVTNLFFLFYSFGRIIIDFCFHHNHNLISFHHIFLLIIFFYTLIIYIDSSLWIRKFKINSYRSYNKKFSILLKYKPILYIPIYYPAILKINKSVLSKSRD